MNRTEEIKKAMALLYSQPNVIFIGQNVAFSGAWPFDDLVDVPRTQILEVPVFEEMQLSMSTGLAIQGFLPISSFPRMDFLLRAADSLINHLDKMSIMSHGQFTPKVIIRTRVGNKKPLDAGPQHSQNHVIALRHALVSIVVEQLDCVSDIVSSYERALARHCSTIIVETI